MPLETATFIDDLNTANPAATDGLSEADDHIRLIKSAIKTTFPNVTGEVTKTHTELNHLAVPIGGIVVWPANAAPAGWFDCDGQAISRDDWPDLFDLIGSDYGNGDGATTFNVPDLDFPSAPVFIHFIIKASDAT